MSTNIFRQDDIDHMLKLEELFYNRFLNSELLNELVSLYVKAIGFCNEKMSVMKVYFLEKMQFLLSRPEIEKLLRENEEEKSADKYTIKISSIEMQYETPQYVRKSSLRSQPVLRKLAEINDEEQKIQERENRINQQLEEMRREIESMGEKFSEKINKKEQQNELISENYLKENISHHIKKQRRKSIRKNSLDLIVEKNEIIESYSGEKIKREEWVGWQRFINQKMRKLGIKEISKKKRVRFEEISLMPINNKKESQKLENKNDLFPLHKTMKSFVFNNNEEEEIIEEEEECQLIEIEREKTNDIKKSAVFYSLSYGTFAGGHNTPEFSETFRINTEPLVFPKPDDENLTDITQVSQENIVRVGDVCEIGEIRIGLNDGFKQEEIETVNNNNNYEKEYVDDDYF